MKAEEIEEALGLAESEMLDRLRDPKLRAAIKNSELVRMVEVLRRHQPPSRPPSYEATDLDLSGLPPERAEEIRRKLGSG